MSDGPFKDFGARREDQQIRQLEAVVVNGGADGKDALVALVRMLVREVAALRSEVEALQSRRR